MINLHYLLSLINNVWVSYQTIIHAQPVLAGAFTLYGMGLFTYIFKGLPSKIFSFLKKQITVSVAIHNESELFQHANNWLSTENKIFRCKSFTATIEKNKKRSYNVSEIDDDNIPDSPYDIKSNKELNKKIINITAGNGNHLFFYERWPFWLSRIEKDIQNSKDRKESLLITTLGWHPKHIKKFLNEISPKPETKDTIKIYNFNNSYWEHIADKNKRQLNSVILTDENYIAIKKHINQYLSSKDWYDMHHIPWRTGIILEGPPGTGKSSLSLALCGEFSYDLYICSLSGATDEKVKDMFNLLPFNGIILIEDIDTFNISNSRISSLDNENSQHYTNDKLGFSSLSGLLNCIDGIGAAENRILVATTNHVEKLDPALIRPGRFELILKIGNLNEETSKKMFNKFYPNHILPTDIVIKENISPAYFQTIAIENKDNPSKLLEKCFIKKGNFF